MKLSSIKQTLTPRAFEHWSRPLGFGNRLEIQTLQYAKVPLTLVNAFNRLDFPWLGKATNYLEKRINSLQEDPYRFSEKFNLVLKKRGAFIDKLAFFGINTASLLTFLSTTTPLNIPHFLLSHSLWIFIAATIGHFGKNIALQTMITNHKTIQLQKSQFEVLAQDSPNIIFTASLDPAQPSIETMKFDFISNAVEQIRGLRPQEAMRQTLAESLAPESLAHFRQIFTEQTELVAQGKGQEIKTFEAKMPHADGSMLCFNVSAKFRFSPDGQPSGIVGSLQDITKQKEAELALRQSIELHQAITETAPSAIISCDERGLIQTWNSSAARIFGYAKEEVIGAPIQLIVPDRYKEVFFEGLRRFHLQDDLPASLEPKEITAAKKGAMEFPAEIFTASYRAGKKRFFTCIIRDISERERVKNALTEQGRMLDTTIAASHIGIGVVDQDRNLTWCNEPMYEMLGYSKAEMMTMPADQVYAEPKEFQRIGSEILPKVRQGGLEETDTRWRRKDGSTFDVWLRFKAYTSVDGQQQIIVLAEDISKRLASQQRLLDMRRQVIASKLVGHLSLWLKNTLISMTGQTVKQERITQQQAAWADILDAFSATGLAQLQNPLKKLSKAQLLPHQQTAQLHQKWQEILSSIEKMQNNMVAFSQAGTEDATVIGARPQITTIVDSLKGYAEQRKVLLSHNLKLSEEDGIFIAESSFQDLLRILVMNAIEAIPAEFSSYSDRLVSVTASKIKSDSIVITIADTGRGMLETEIAKLLRKEDAAIYNPEDIGHGWTIVNNVIETSRGKITIESEIDSGTNVTIEFPIVPFKTEPAKIEAIDLSPQISRQEASKLTIMLVDDMPGVLSRMEDELKSLGFNVAAFSDPRKALLSYKRRKNKPHIVLIDLNMPDYMYGDALLKKIAVLPEAQKLSRFALFSAEPMPDDPANPLAKTLTALNAAFILKGPALKQFKYDVTGIARQIIDQTPVAQQTNGVAKSKKTALSDNPLLKFIKLVNHKINNLAAALPQNDKAEFRKALQNFEAAIAEFLTFTKSAAGLTTVKDLAESDLLPKILTNRKEDVKEIFTALKPQERYKLAIIIYLYLSQGLLKYRDTLLDQAKKKGYNKAEIDELTESIGKYILSTMQIETDHENAATFQAYYEILSAM